MNELALRNHLQPWPGVTASVKWRDDLVFCVAAKMFCVYCFRGAHLGTISFKVETERFLELTDRPGIRPAPYMARSHWIQLERSDVLAEPELIGLVERSYALVRAGLTKKQQRELAAC